MQNWLGQEINVGDYVYRGARDGNSSTFKIGLVVAERDDKVRVLWLFEDGWKVIRDANGVFVDSVPGAKPLNDSFGWLDPRSLFVIDPAQAKEIIERLTND